MVLWPLFGTTNQLLAGLTLLVISIVLVRSGRPARYTMIPMVFVSTAALLAALYQLWTFFQTSQYLLLGLDALIVISAVFVMLEAISALGRRSSA
jgi:carbon starvation protein